MGSVFVPCFVVQYSVSFLILQSSSWGREMLAALLCLSSWCLVIIVVLLLFLTVPWIGLQCVIVVFPPLLYWSQNTYTFSSPVPLISYIKIQSKVRMLS